MQTKLRRRSVCRVCSTGCPILVEVDSGKAIRVTADRSNNVFEGYTCVKGRAQPQFLNHPNRLLTSLRRAPDGSYGPISSERAMDEIADRLQDILRRYGPRAVAHYFGFGGIPNSTTTILWPSFMDAIGSPMRFDPVTIDKSGKFIARAMHGNWMAPLQGYNDPEVVLLIGVNPFITYQGLPAANPARWLTRAQDKGLKLVVIDPRRTPVARRAWIHLQCRPGYDVELIASMIKVILDERLYDQEFVLENTSGLDDLKRSVADFTPSAVAALADVEVDDLVGAARAFSAQRGYAYAGTGPSMSGPSTLLEYLVLNLETICGHCLREGERVRNPGTFRPALEPKAQAAPPRPAYGFGEQMRVRGLTATPSGLPTAALADEILMEGERQVRALISCGNPVASWPDQPKTIEAMKRLDLLVQLDPWMSQTARYAHYVIAPKMPLEVPGINISADVDIAHGAGYSLAEAYGHYSPALVEPPIGSDLIEEWEFYYGVARRMGLSLTVRTWVCGDFPPQSLDMENKPTTDDLLELVTKHARVPFQHVKAQLGGSLFPDPAVFVHPKDPGWTARLELANPDMMRDLIDRATRHHALPDAQAGGGYAFRLVCRREMHLYNSTYNVSATNHGRGYNPAFMHPSDMDDLGLAPGDIVRITSTRGSILGVVNGDESLRRGLVSMAHGFGNEFGDDSEFTTIGSNTNRLIHVDRDYDRFSGQPRMSNVPISISRYASGS